MKLLGYIESKEDPLIQIVRAHQHHTDSTQLQRFKMFRRSFQSETKQIQNIKEKWEEGRMHRQFPRSLDEQQMDKEQSKFGDIKGQTESTAVAAQDQALSTD
jgi:hypothetical protein